jgi:hypothetical protein
MSYKLFIDDDRLPKNCVSWMKGRTDDPSIYLRDDWVVVRDLAEMVKVITERGLPEFVSFDHDLGKNNVKKLIAQGFSKRKARKIATFEISGMHCASFLETVCRMMQQPLPKYAVHSLNPVGTENLLTFLRNAEKELSKSEK